MGRQRQRGTEATSGSIYIRPSAYKVPMLTCANCGKVFPYRGIQDADCVKGTTYDPETGTYISSGGSTPLCKECLRKTQTK